MRSKLSKLLPHLYALSFALAVAGFARPQSPWGY
jgi:hypothetical protein